MERSSYGARDGEEAAGGQVPSNQDGAETPPSRAGRTADESEPYGKEVDQKLSYTGIATGDELQLEDTPALWRAAGLTEDSVRVLRAKAKGTAYAVTSATDFTP
jgi:hypothetical protein